MAERKLGLVCGQVELTSDCFQRCVGCESWRDNLNGRHQGVWSLDNLVQLLDEIQKWFGNTFEHLSFTGGDPQSWPHLRELFIWIDKRTTGGEWLWDFQVSTALTRDIAEAEGFLWRTLIHDVRISLDGATSETYNKIRRDQLGNTPVRIVERACKLSHPRTAFITTVFEENVDEMFEIAALVDSYWRRGELPLRRHMFLAALGARKGRHADEFWEKWRVQAERISSELDGYPSSLAEDPRKVYEEIMENKHLPCRVGNVSFHLKADGSYYPCCLVGGEAIATCPPLKIGDFPTHSLFDLYWKFNSVSKHYGNGTLPCRQVCQFKQFSLNKIAEEAAGTRMAMP